MNILVLGAGRAGTRHAQGLHALGVQVETCDPLVDGAHYHVLEDALNARRWQGVVIASPPGAHLAQIRACGERGLPYLCEKPLCGLDEYAQACATMTEYAHLGMMAFNYRFHQHIERPPEAHRQDKLWLTTAEQCRMEWPSWGFLLDHFSHPLDTINALAGPLEMTAFTEEYSQWCYRGKLEALDAQGRRVLIMERVNKTPSLRYVWLQAPWWQVELDVDKGMYARMLTRFCAFTAGVEPYPDMASGLAVQGYLQKAHELSQA